MNSNVANAVMVFRVFLFLNLFCFSGLAANEPIRLTLREAQQMALTNHPRISVATLTALAAQEVTKEVRSAYLPNIYASATAADNADSGNTRIAAGGLNNPRVYEREADGITISQLITDFGRTSELTRSAKLRSRAEKVNIEATREQVLLEVDNAFFSALSAQAVMQVSQETVKTRQFVQQQTSQLATNKMKSLLDLSFADVDLDQAKILMVKARNDLNSSFAVLGAVLAMREPHTFVLADEPLPGRLTNDIYGLIFEALSQRPELVRLRYQSDAAKEFARAQGKLVYPTVQAMGVAGVIPTGQSQFAPDYLAGGVNINVPLYSGGLYTARRHEAEDQAKAASENLRAEEDDIIRDVQITKLNLDYAFDRIALTQQLLENANKALELAQARFRAGLSSIVELSQAELNQTSAQIAEANARYDYQIKHSALEFQLGHLR